MLQRCSAPTISLSTVSLNMSIRKAKHENNKKNVEINKVVFWMYASPWGRKKRGVQNLNIWKEDLDLWHSGSRHYFKKRKVWLWVIRNQIQLLESVFIGSTFWFSVMNVGWAYCVWICATGNTDVTSIHSIRFYVRVKAEVHLYSTLKKQHCQKCLTIYDHQTDLFVKFKRVNK